MSQTGLLLIWLGIGIQRLLELWLAKRNAKWMKSQGGYEVGKEHYPWIVLIHLLFFIGIAIESFYFGKLPPTWWPIPLALFVMIQFFRIWCIRSLGQYWNTRIWVVPDHQIKEVGPYRYLRHPNYLIVIAEFLVVPMIFGAMITMVITSLLNAIILLKVRIPLEEKALEQVGNYAQLMGEKEKLIPIFKKVKKT